MMKNPKHWTLDDVSDIIGPDNPPKKVLGESGVPQHLVALLVTRGFAIQRESGQEVDAAILNNGMNMFVLGMIIQKHLAEGRATNDLAYQI